jgi:hypothetical protein
MPTEADGAVVVVGRTLSIALGGSGMCGRATRQAVFAVAWLPTGHRCLPVSSTSFLYRQVHPKGGEMYSRNQ